LLLKEGKVDDATKEFSESYIDLIESATIRPLVMQYAAMNMGHLCLKRRQRNLAAKYYRQALNYGTETDASVWRSCIIELYNLYSNERSNGRNQEGADALINEVNLLQKPKHVIFVLDVSGSMREAGFMKVSTEVIMLITIAVSSCFFHNA
jgi:hypothetical protein